MNIVPDVELIAASDTALITPGEAHSIEVLIDIEFQYLREGK
jgi:hypothetical protein